ncbi:MAG TPA: methyltransferase domain-containing protein [bacterium]|nr:methyltransferase domain-containing protein [bacterium]
MQSNLNFRLMAIEFWLRDLLKPPGKILIKAGVAPGMKVLDFGCGPGGFSVAAAEIVESCGEVYAVDIHPLALQSIEKARKRLNLPNLHPLHGSKTGDLQDQTIDRILLYDILHDVEDPQRVKRELHRLLKPDGLISIKDHRLRDDEVRAQMTREGLFRPAGSKEETLLFERI